MSFIPWARMGRNTEHTSESWLLVSIDTWWHVFRDPHRYTHTGYQIITKILGQIQCWVFLRALAHHLLQFSRQKSRHCYLWRGEALSNFMSWTYPSNLQNHSLPNANVIQVSLSPKQTRDSSIDIQIQLLICWGQSCALTSLQTMAWTASHCLPEVLVYNFTFSGFRPWIALLSFLFVSQSHPSLSCRPSLTLGHPVLPCFFPLSRVHPWPISCVTRVVFGLWVSSQKSSSVVPILPLFITIFYITEFSRPGVSLAYTSNFLLLNLNKLKCS